MKYSFIIPAYNEEKLISCCIKSIKRQKIKDFEIIVVDDGCVDRTVKIARDLGCRVVKESKRSFSLARNKGALNARGEILCFIDADGVLSDNWLYQVEKTFIQKDVDVVSGLVYFSHKNIFKRVWYNIYTFFAFFGLFSLFFFGKRLFLVGNNIAIKKKLFDSLGGFKPVIGEDFWLSLGFWGKKNKKGTFNPKMSIAYSSRGFESYGYLKTILYWLINTIKQTPQKSYSYKNKT